MNLPLTLPFIGANRISMLAKIGQMRIFGSRATASRDKPSLRRRRNLFAPVLLATTVVLPVSLVAGYMYFFASDQYASQAAFSIRSEQGGVVSQGFLGAIASMGGTGSAQDTDLLFDYIRSQAIVEAVDEKLNLRNIFRQRGADWLFSLRPEAPIEDVVRYWNRMVSVSNESRNGILQVEVKAFTPKDAQLILQKILSESSDLINQLSEEARADSLRPSGEMVDEARRDLQELRRQLTDFRRENQIVTPEIEAQTRSVLIGELQGRIADSLVERDSILAYTNERDQRVQNIDNRIESLRAQLEQERVDLLQSRDDNDVDVFGVYESLLVDQEMLNIAYSQALASQASAHAEARRQARYVAVHVPPSLAQTPLYPERLKTTLGV